MSNTSSNLHTNSSNSFTTVGNYSSSGCGYGCGCGCGYGCGCGCGCGWDKRKSPSKFIISK